MNIARPLQNPSRLSELASQPEPLEGDLDIVVNEKQLTLPIQTPKRSRWAEWLHQHWVRLRYREVELEMMPFWREMAAPFAITSSTLTIVGLLIGGLVMFGRVAPTIPFYYNSVEAHWEPADKSVLLFAPVLLFLVEAALLRMIYEVYFHDRRLSTMLSWTLTVINILIVLAALEVYTLSS